MGKKVIKVGMHKMGSSTFYGFFYAFKFLFDRYTFVDSADPDFLFCGNTVPRNNKINIFYTNEAYGADIRNTKWSFGSQLEKTVNNPCYMRQPYYVRLGAGADLIKDISDPYAVLKQKTKFCNFIYNHPVPIRSAFFHALEKYKPVDSPGSVCQNMPPIGLHADAYESRFGLATDPFKEKLQFIQPYKFTIAFNNVNFPGYTDEKIYHPMLVNSIPIFWGNPHVNIDFNTRSFINAHDKEFSTKKDMFDYLISRIIELDKDDDKYVLMLKEPWYPNNTITPAVDPQRILNRFTQIFGT